MTIQNTYCAPQILSVSSKNDGNQRKALALGPVSGYRVEEGFGSLPPKDGARRAEVSAPLTALSFPVALARKGRRSGVTLFSLLST